jgi:hypothetical protein
METLDCNRPGTLEDMMNRKSLLSRTLALAVLLSSLTSVILAQEPEPQVEEPGSSVDATATSQPDTWGSDILAPTSWAFSGGPNYDSGWVSLEQDETVTLDHDLGGDTDNYVVDMQYRGSSFNGVNQRYYGGIDFGAVPPAGHSVDDRVGAYWCNLTNTTITVYRRAEDTYAPAVRIRIWVDPIPGYDSGWISLSPGATATTLNHGLGGDTDDYVVDLQFKNTGNGVNQRYYGGADLGANAGDFENNRVGAYWRSLTNSYITVYRRPEDTYAAQMRIRIWIRPTPTYDSGWVSIDQRQLRTLAHNIGGDPADYVVDMQFRNTGSGSGVNQQYYGGADYGALVGSYEDNRVGAYWRGLDFDSITVYRRGEDNYAPEVRIRIWCFWKPPAPDYDSDWVSLTPGAAATTLTHNLGGSADDYFVDLQYRSAGSGINRRYNGGTDFGANVYGKEDFRVGAYWRSLNDATITVYRRPEDTYAEQVRIRIWVMPTPDYDSGWIGLATGASTERTHNLGGDYFDYFVDLQHRSAASGVNQCYYGGADFGANTSGMENYRVGAYWRGLDTTSITVYRRPEDVFAPEVRVRIWRVANPDYESGWQVVSQGGSETWSHNLGSSAQSYLVNMIYYDESVNYVNQRHLGGIDFGAVPPVGYSVDDRVGAYWRSLTNSSITVFRRHEDGFADYLRIRIWATPFQTYLPLILENY